MATVCVKATERLLGIMTPSTPEASAVLKIDPRLCGSSKPSKINTVDNLSCAFVAQQMHQSPHIHMEQCKQQHPGEVNLTIHLF